MKARLPLVSVSMIITAVLLLTLAGLVSAQASHVPIAGMVHPVVKG